MERLTERFKNGQAAVYGCGSNCKYDYKYCESHLEDCPTISEIYEKLAEYEDLEERLQLIYGECDGLLEKVVEHLERHEDVNIPAPVFKTRLLTDGEVDRWEEFKDLEGQGKLLKLPCAVGDVIYQIDESDCELCETERPEINEKCTCKIGDFCGYEEITVVGFKLDMLDDFGKTVFLTRPEAEQALKEMEGKK